MYTRDVSRGLNHGQVRKKGPDELSEPLRAHGTKLLEKKDRRAIK